MRFCQNLRFTRTPCEELPATIHRVIDLGQDRYSAPMFVEPSYSNQSYAKNIITGKQWTGKNATVLKEAESHKLKKPKI